MRRRPNASERAHSSGSFCSCNRQPPVQLAQPQVLAVSGGDLLRCTRRPCRVHLHLSAPLHSLPLRQAPSKSFHHLDRLVSVSWWEATMSAHHEMTWHCLFLHPLARPLLPPASAPQAAVAARPVVAQLRDRFLPGVLTCWASVAARWPMIVTCHLLYPPRAFVCLPPALGCISACDPLLPPPLPLTSVTRVQVRKLTQR